MKGKLYTDGGARPTNPGHAGIGCVVELEDGEEYLLSRYIGRKTNNEAELTALIVGVGYASFVGAQELDIFCDSLLVVNGLNGEWNLKEERIKILVREAEKKIRGHFLDDYTITHIRREDNARADEICTDAIIWGMNRSPWIPKKIRESRPEGKVLDPFNCSAKRVTTPPPKPPKSGVVT